MLAYLFVSHATSVHRLILGLPRFWYCTVFQINLTFAPNFAPRTAASSRGLTSPSGISKDEGDGNFEPVRTKLKIFLSASKSEMRPSFSNDRCGIENKKGVSAELRLVFWFCSIIRAETAIRCYKALLSSSFEAPSVRVVQMYVPASSHELAEMLGGGRQLLAWPYHLIRECSLCPLVYVEDRIDGLGL